MTRVPKKMAVGTHISVDDKVKLDILKEKSYIKSISEGVRRAVNDFLKKPEVILKLHTDVSQTTIPNYSDKIRDYRKKHDTKKE